MMTTPPTKYPRRRGHRYRPRAATQAPSQALILVAATYSKDEATLTLTFDRAIALDGFDGAAITVNDDWQMNVSYDASGGATITSPDTVVLGLVETGAPTGPGQSFTATAGTGIVGIDDGGTWAGAVDQGLPFP